MQILFSFSYSPTIDLEPGPFGEHHVDVALRSSDWGKVGLAKKLHHAAEAVRVMRQARRYPVLVLCTTGIESFFVGRWKKYFCPRTKVVCADILLPDPSSVPPFMRRWLRGIDLFACIRTGDIETLNKRFGVPRSKSFFVHFPADARNPLCADEDEGYIYSAGFAHRDWDTLVEALSQLNYRALLSPGAPVPIPNALKERVAVLPPQDPASGRKILSKARLIVMPLEDTRLPSGPLVLLDAMAMGKPVVATNVNGTRDYVIDGRTALLVPPKDPRAMAAAIALLMEDKPLRRSMGLSAHDDVRQRFTTRQFIERIVARVGG